MSGLSFKIRHLFSSVFIITLILSILLGVCFSAAYDLIGEAGRCVLSPEFVLRAFILTVILFFSFKIGLRVLEKTKSSKSSWAHITTQWVFCDHVMGIMRPMTIMLACWTPYFILMYPGNIYMDTSGQIAWFAHLCDTGDWTLLSSRHPLFDTMIFGSIIWGIYSLTGHFRIAVFVFVLLQAMLTAFSFSFALRVAKNSWKCPSGLLIGALVFFAICPLIPCSVCSISKDSLFSFIYVLFLTVFIDKLRGGALSKNNILLFTLALLMCLTKKYGAYVSILSLLVLAAAYLGNFRDRLQLILSAVICALIIGVAIPCFERGVKMGGDGAQEMLSVPLQQTALSLIRHSDEMSNDEIDIIGQVINVESITEDYVPQNADGVKGYAPRTDNAGYAAYLQVWLNQSFRFPRTYLDAWAALESPLFSATPIQQIFDSHHTTRDEILPEGYWEKSDWNAQGSLFVESMYDWLTTVPVLNVFMLAFPYVVIIPAFLLIVLVKCRRIRLFAILIPILVSLGGVLLAPISSGHFEATRYVLPFIYTAPIILSFAWNMLHEDVYEG